MIVQDELEHQTMSLTDAQLDAAWERSAARPHGQKRYVAFARQMEATLTAAGVQPGTMPAMCVFDDRSKLLAWAHSGVPQMAKAVNTLESLNYQVDHLHSILADYASRWGQS